MFSSNVFLTQTDTTVGFVSQDKHRLTAIKQRPPYKHYIKAVDSFKTLNTLTRIPAIHKRFLRRASRTTFILPNSRSYRVIQDKRHLLLLSRLKWAYTTSANLSEHPYDEAFAKAHADIVVEPLYGEQTPSAIFRLGRQTLKRIR